MFTNCWITNVFSSEKTKFGSSPLSVNWSNSLALTSLTFFCASVSSMALLQVHFSIFAEWHIAICSAYESFFGRISRISIKSLLYFSNHFCWCCCFFFRPLLWRRQIYINHACIPSRKTFFLNNLTYIIKNVKRCRYINETNTYFAFQLIIHNQKFLQCSLNLLTISN